MSDDRLERLENKIDLIKEAAEVVKERISSINTTLALQHQSLVEHIKRTEILEKAVIPLQTHMNTSSSMLKVLGFLALLAGGITGVVDLLKYLSGK